MGQTKKSTKKAQSTAAKAKAKSLASMVKPEAVALKSWNESRFGVVNGTKLGIVRVLGITTPSTGNEEGYNLILMDGSKIGTAKKHVSTFIRLNELRDSVYCTPTFKTRKLDWLEASEDAFPVGDLIDTHLDEYQVMDGDEVIDKNDRITLKLDGKMVYSTVCTSTILTCVLMKCQRMLTWREELQLMLSMMLEKCCMKVCTYSIVFMASVRK